MVRSSVPPTSTPTATATPRKPTTAPSRPGEILEPLTILLMGGGLAALAGYARRRRMAVGRREPGARKEGPRP